MAVPETAAISREDAPEARADQRGPARATRLARAIPPTHATTPPQATPPTKATRPTQATRPAVEIAHLRKAYGPLVAVDDVSLTVAEGDIFGILGPNGAGKTTAVECATGLRTPDAGTVRLLGLDPHADRDQVHEIVGVQLHAGALP